MIAVTGCALLDLISLDITTWLRVPGLTVDPDNAFPPNRS